MTCTYMFIAPLFIMGKRWKQSNIHQLAMEKQMYIHTVEPYQAIKSDEVLIHATMWLNFKKHYAEWKKPDPKDHIHDMISFWWNVQKRQIYKYKKQINGCLGLEVEGLQMGMRDLLEVMEVFQNWIVVMFSQLYKFNNHWILHSRITELYT